jgi:hypothetical protein
MTQATITRNYPGKSPDALFAAALDAMPKAGFQVWKKRPLGWLVLAKRKVPEGLVQVNLAFRPGAAATLSLTGEGVSGQTLEALGAEALTALEAALK